MASHRERGAPMKPSSGSWPCAPGWCSSASCAGPRRAQSAVAAATEEQPPRPRHAPDAGARAVARALPSTAAARLPPSTRLQALSANWPAESPADYRVESGARRRGVVRWSLAEATAAAERDAGGDRRRSADQARTLHQERREAGRVGGRPRAHGPRRRRGEELAGVLHAAGARGRRQRDARSLSRG